MRRRRPPPVPPPLGHYPAAPGTGRGSSPRAKTDARGEHRGISHHVSGDIEPQVATTARVIAVMASAVPAAIQASSGNIRYAAAANLKRSAPDWPAEARSVPDSALRGMVAADPSSKRKSARPRNRAARKGSGPAGSIKPPPSASRGSGRAGQRGQGARLFRHGDIATGGIHDGRAAENLEGGVENDGRRAEAVDSGTIR